MCVIHKAYCARIAIARYPAPLPLKVVDDFISWLTRSRSVTVLPRYIFTWKIRLKKRAGFPRSDRHQVKHIIAAGGSGGDVQSLDLNMGLRTNLNLERKQPAQYRN